MRGVHITSALYPRRSPIACGRGIASDSSRDFKGNYLVLALGTPAEMEVLSIMGTLNFLEAIPAYDYAGARAIRIPIRT